MGGGQGAIKAEMVFDVIPQVWHVYMPGKSWGDYNVCIYIAHTHTHIYIYDIYIYKHMCIYNCNMIWCTILYLYMHKIYVSMGAYIYILQYILYMWIFGPPRPGNLRHIDDHTACDGTVESSTSGNHGWLTMKFMGENPGKWNPVNQSLMIYTRVCFQPYFTKHNVSHGLPLQVEGSKLVPNQFNHVLEIRATI